MEQYISKSALVAEIKRRKELVSDPILLGNDLLIGERNAYFNLLSFIESLEVKGVELEKELNIYLEKVKETDEDIVFKDFAKHFFELGMQVSNKQIK